MKQDHRKLARERLVKLNIYKAQCERLKSDLPQIIERELVSILHAYLLCSVGGDNQQKIKQCAEFIAQRISPTINTTLKP